MDHPRTRDPRSPGPDSPSPSAPGRPVAARGPAARTTRPAGAADAAGPAGPGPGAAGSVADAGVDLPLAGGYRPRTHRGVPPPGRPLGARVLATLTRLVRPSTRLTGFGTGVVTTGITLLGAAVDAWLFDGPGVLFGLVFVLASIAGALWVRPYDLAAAPVSAPIAFATALAVCADSGSGGFLGHFMGMVTGLATHTAWLYAGTAISTVLVIGRKIAARRPAVRR